MNQKNNHSQVKRITAFQFILLMGIVSLFGDITYEGARSITGPFLALLGAGAGIVGLVAGAGEFIGYAARLISGYLSDRTKAYWMFVIIGYGLIFSIPFLAFVNHWQLAILLIILERVGKGIRAPARDAILSHVTKNIGRGVGFGIHEAMDQIGAIMGPMLFSVVFFLKGDYRDGFIILTIPALLCMVVLLLARKKVPSPASMEFLSVDHEDHIGEKEALSRVFWSYSIFTFMSCAGFLNFQLISYHFKLKGIMPDVQIPMFYAIAMGVDALTAIISGRMYDRFGLITLIVIPFISLLIPLFTLSQSYYFIISGIVFWGIAMGLHETIMRAGIADLTHPEQRGTAYGIFNTIYGGSWLLGGIIMGLLYDLSINYLILFAISLQTLSIPVLFITLKYYKTLNNV